MRERGHEDIKELVAAYVLGAIPQDEIPFVRDHILSCDECMAEADSYTEAAGSLALAANPIATPAGFADRVMAAATLRTEVESEVSVLDDRRSRRGGWRAVAATATSVALVVSFISIYVTLAANDELDRTEKVLTALLHNAEGTFAMRGPGGAVAQVVPTLDGAYLIAAGLQEAPSKHVYQLWLMRDGNPVSAGLFDGTDDVSIVETQADLNRYEAAAITIEPEGGSAEPTSDPILTSG